MAMELNDSQLQEFRTRALQAKTYGYTIAHADLYVATLAAEVGQEIIPMGMKKGSAEHLHDLAEQALAQRLQGGRKQAKKAKAQEPTPEPQKVVEAAPAEQPDPFPAPAKEEGKAEDSGEEPEEKSKKKSGKK